VLAADPIRLFLLPVVPIPFAELNQSYPGLRVQNIHALIADATPTAGTQAA
jgi:hypothetical protein